MKKSAGRQIERAIARGSKTDDESEWRALHRQAVDEGRRTNAESEREIQDFFLVMGRRLAEETAILATAQVLSPRIDVYTISESEDQSPPGENGSTAAKPTWERVDCLCGLPHFLPEGRSSIDERFDLVFASLETPAIAIWSAPGDDEVDEDGDPPEIFMYVKHSGGGTAAVLQSCGEHWRLPLGSEIPQEVFQAMFMKPYKALDVLAEPFQLLREGPAGSLEECLGQLRTSGVDAPALSELQWRALVDFIMPKERLLQACSESSRMVADAHVVDLISLLDFTHHAVHRSMKQVRDSIAQLEKEAKVEEERRRARFHADQAKSRQLTEGIKARANRLERELQEAQRLLRSSQLGKEATGSPSPSVDRVRSALDALF
jgi:hypothetical protein